MAVKSKVSHERGKRHQLMLDKLSRGGGSGHARNGSGGGDDSDDDNDGSDYSNSHGGFDLDLEDILYGIDTQWGALPHGGAYSDTHYY
ncbi:hypothetical protein OF83DRAFT_1174114 [Amylostereum chailletii]|nr:hypothetical protein OF83DRAFT_1174114 [Amylostereum chailletii]